MSNRCEEFHIFERACNVSTLQMETALNWIQRCSPSSQEAHPIRYNQPRVLVYVVESAVELAGG